MNNNCNFKFTNLNINNKNTNHRLLTNQLKLYGLFTDSNNSTTYNNIYNNSYYTFLQNHFQKRFWQLYRKTGEESHRKSGLKESGNTSLVYVLISNLLRKIVKSPTYFILINMLLFAFNNK